VGRAGRSCPFTLDGVSTVAIACLADGRAHEVPDVQLAAPPADHRGQYRAVCGHRVTPGSLVEPDGAPCPFCASRC